MTNIVISKQRKTFIGIVSSNKNDKTIIVTVETSKRHSLYHKSFKSIKKYHAHDENNQAQIGDKVEIISTRPFSALKRFRLLKIITSKTNVEKV